MRYYLKKYRGANLLAVLLALVVCALQTGNNLLMMQTFQSIIELDLRGFFFWSLLLTGSWFVLLWINGLQEYCQGRAIRLMNNNLRRDMTATLLAKSHTDFHEKDTGEYLSWFTNDVNQIETLAWQPFYQCVAAAASALFSAVALLTLHWSLLAAALVNVVVMMLVPRLFNKRMEKLGKDCEAGQAQATGRLKLIKFATRVPVFMYLTDYREYSLKDVITQLEPELFKKVTGLNVKDFELLVSLNVFNEALMNDAVYKFKRYEDASLSYTGIDRHVGGDVGLYSTVLSREDYDLMAGQLIRSMEAPAQAEDDVPDKPYYAEDVPDGEDEPEPAPVAKKPPVPRPPIAAKTPIPTYRPAYIPPTPAPIKKSAPVVDVSGITAGSAVFHKAFGTGIVQSVGGGYIVVSFDGLEKKFQFPGAFQQGFLRKG